MIVFNDNELKPIQFSKFRKKYEDIDLLQRYSKLLEFIKEVELNGKWNIKRKELLKDIEITQ